MNKLGKMEEFGRKLERTPASDARRGHEFSSESLGADTNYSVIISDYRGTRGARNAGDEPGII